jgi:hypothetical protein
MPPAPTARVGLRERADRCVWLALAALALGCGALSCGGKAEDPPSPGSSFPTPGSARPTASSPGAAPGGRELPEETCEENPLLAQCPRSSSGGVPSLPEETCADNPLLAGCSPLPRLDDPSLSPVERAEAVLDARCGSCHGDPNVLSCGLCDGMYDIGDMRKMISTGKIIPCRWTESLIYQRISRREMPPRSTNLAAPTREELAIVGTAVDGLCDELSAGGPVVRRQAAALESWLASDCGGCHANTPADAGAIPPVPVDVPGLVAAGLIKPCDRSGSPLLQRLRDDSMPPPGVSPRPTAFELRELEAFIDLPCSHR